MRILAIDSSAVSASCAVVEDGRILAQSFVNVGLTHSETLLKLIADTLEDAQVSLPETDYLAVSAGPGSFTGIRIGVSTVKGMAFTEQMPCVGVSTLEAIASGMTGLSDGCICCPVMDARRSQVYNALFRVGDTAERLCGDRAVSIEDLAAELREKYAGQTVYLCGDGAELCMSRMQGAVSGVRLAPVQLRCQTGYGVAVAAARVIAGGGAVTHERLAPVYLRPSQAERELAEKGKAPV